MFAEHLLLGAAVALLVTGGLAATTSASPLKRVAGVALALAGAILSLTVLHAGQAAMIAGAGVAFALVALGVAIVVRLQEGYGAAEASDLDAADRETEPTEPNQ